MVQRYEVNGSSSYFEDVNGSLVDYSDYQKLEAENVRLRQQIDCLVNQTPVRRIVRSNMDECD